MGRGRSSFGGSSRGSSSFGGGGRGSSSFRSGRSGGIRSHHTTVIIGGHGHHYHSSGSPIIGIIVGAIFCLIGLAIFFGGASMFLKVNDYATVQAECVKNESSGMWYYTTYNYTVDGTNYTNRSIQGWEFPEENIGGIITIYYLKSDPNVISEENPVDKSLAGILIFVGVVTAALGSLPLSICVKEMKKSKAGGVGETSPTIDSSSESSRCPYCGAKYNRNSYSCPKCGASKME